MNKVILTGNLGQNAELKKTSNDSVGFVRVSLATSKSWKDKEGNKQSKTEWHTLVFWGKTAENFVNFGKKGKKFLIEGEIEYPEFTDKDGNKRKGCQIRVTTWEPLSPKEGGAGTPDHAPADYNADRDRGGGGDSFDEDFGSAPAPAPGDYTDDIPF